MIPDLDDHYSSSRYEPCVSLGFAIRGLAKSRDCSVITFTFFRFSVWRRSVGRLAQKNDFLGEFVVSQILFHHYIFLPWWLLLRINSITFYNLICSISFRFSNSCHLLFAIFGILFLQWSLIFRIVSILQFCCLQILYYYNVKRVL